MTICTVLSALPPEKRRLIEQLFWAERTETEVANTMNINQSTINRRKQAILNCLRMKLRYRNEFQDSLHKDSVRCNLTKWSAARSPKTKCPVDRLLNTTISMNATLDS